MVGIRIGQHVSDRGGEKWFTVSSMSPELEELNLEDFKMCLRHIPKKRLNAIYKRHTKKVRVRGGGSEERLNRRAFFKEFVEECILGWEGLTIRVLKKMVALEGLPEGVSDDDEVSFDTQQAIDLFDATYHLEPATADYVTDPGRFVESDEEEEVDHEAEVGNS